MDTRTYEIDLMSADKSATSYKFSKDHVVVGHSHQDCDIAIFDQAVLARHLCIERTTNNQFQVTSFSAARNVYLNGRPLRPYQPILWKDGQSLKIGQSTLTLREHLSLPRKFTQLAEISKWAIIAVGVPALVILLLDATNLSLTDFPNVFTLIFSLIFILHSLFTLTWMLYGWNKDVESDPNRSPQTFEPPEISFTALIPARHEERVIQDTIRAVNRINYPDALKEILVLCRQDDMATIAKAREIIAEMGQSNIQLVVFNTLPINKPHSLNHGLDKARHDVIAIFDAEDEPHPDLYQIVNTIMLRDGADAVQSGVQLMNHCSHWFSILNVLEYFFWFRSGLHFFAKLGQVTPLGGNTVFIKKDFLNHIGGWDEECLTEDADIGIQLARHGANIRIVYDERHTTREETPETTGSFIRQRARWNQGFLQILFKGDWARLPTLKQQMVAAYILFSPMIQALLIVALPFGLSIALSTRLHIGIALISFTPLYMLLLQFAIHLYGLVEFTRAYRLRFPVWLPFALFITYYPYQIVLAFSAFRAVFRVAANRTNWEKTAHANAHRQFQPEAGVY